MDEKSSLRKENHALQAKIQGLQYENQMYKQLVDNLLKRSEPARSLFQGQPRTDDSIGAGNASFQYHPSKEHGVAFLQYFVSIWKNIILTQSHTF